MGDHVKKVLWVLNNIFYNTKDVSYQDILREYIKLGFREDQLNDALRKLVSDKYENNYITINGEGVSRTVNITDIGLNKIRK